jgi:parallel beta-helix repeat protein
MNNDVTGTAATGSRDSFGIVVSGSDNTVVEGNRVSDTSAGHISYGIFVQVSFNVMVVNNRIATADNGVFYRSSTGEYRDNITDGVTTPYTGGTNIGNNN